MTSNASSDDVIQGLLDVEAAVLEKMSVLHTHHQELQSVDYDADARLLRPYLDMWMDWHIWASYWVAQAKVAQWKADQAYREALQKVMMSTREIDLAAALTYHSAASEREVYYQSRTRNTRGNLDLTTRLVKVITDFIFALKTITEHWDKRRVDTKWETDRIARLPGSDYRN